MLSIVLCLLVLLFLLAFCLPVYTLLVIYCICIFSLVMTHNNEFFVDTIISTNSTNASCAAYCSYNTNNEVTNNDPQARSAVCIGTPLTSHLCSAANVSVALNCFCAVSDNDLGTWTLPTAFNPMTGIADISLCQQRCDALGAQCQGYIYNRSTQTCTLKSQLLPDTQTSYVNASIYGVSSINMYNISPGPDTIPDIWYTFDDYTPVFTNIQNYGTLGTPYNGTLATGLASGTKATVTLSPIAYNNNIVLTNCLSLSVAQKQYMSIPTFTFGGGSFTVCFWYNAATGNSTYSRVFDFGNGSPSQNLIFLFQSSTLTCQIYNDTTRIVNTTIMNTGSSANGSWRHIALVCTYTTDTSCTYTCYVNSISGISFVGPVLLQTSRTNNYIGKSNWSTDPYITMSMNDFRLYSTALTSSQINSIMYSIFLPPIPSNFPSLTFTNKNGSTYSNGLFTLPAASSVSYCYCNYGMSLLNKIVSFDVKSEYIGNFVFFANNTGAGQMIRVETRKTSGYTTAAITTTTSWTAWTPPTLNATTEYKSFNPNQWYHFDVVFTAVPGTDNLSIQLALYVDSSLWYSKYTVSNKGNYIGFNGDKDSGKTYFKNLSIR